MLSRRCAHIRYVYTSHGVTSKHYNICIYIYILSYYLHGIIILCLSRHIRVRVRATAYDSCISNSKVPIYTYIERIIILHYMYVGRWYSENAASKSRCEAVFSSRNVVAFCYCYYSHQPTYIVYLNVNIIRQVIVTITVYLQKK